MVNGQEIILCVSDQYITIYCFLQTQDFKNCNSHYLRKLCIVNCISYENEIPCEFFPFQISKNFKNTKEKDECLLVPINEVRKTQAHIYRQCETPSQSISS